MKKTWSLFLQNEIKRFQVNKREKERGRAWKKEKTSIY